MPPLEPFSSPAAAANWAAQHLPRTGGAVSVLLCAKHPHVTSIERWAYLVLSRSPRGYVAFHTVAPVVFTSHLYFGCALGGLPPLPLLRNVETKASRVDNYGEPGEWLRPLRRWGRQ